MICRDVIYRAGVVPRKGDVDRNIEKVRARAWLTVVPRKGDVDRNTNTSGVVEMLMSRPPQGGRG